MVIGKNSIAVLLITSCLAVTFFATILTSSSQGAREYDPWVDVNNDGKIDILDIAIVAKAFGTEGQAITKASLQYDSGWIDLTGQTSQYHTLTHNLNLAATDMIVDVRQKTQELNKTYGGAGDDAARSLVQTVDGGYALAGVTASFGAGYADCYLVRTDADGNMLWNKTYGGASYDAAYSLVQTVDGGYALAGKTGETGWFGEGYCDCYLVRTDADGNMLWNKTYGGKSSDPGVVSLVQTVDGGYTLAGGYSNFYLVRTDADGNMLWSKTYGGAGDDAARSLVQTADGGYALAGVTRSFGAGWRDCYLVKTEGESGLAWFSSTMDSITVVRDATTPWSFVRVQTWKKR